MTGTITIGQDSPGVIAAEDVLITDGAKVLQADMALVPGLGWTAFPIISYFVGDICTWVSEFIVGNLDTAGYMIYVAAKTGKQVSDYEKAQDNGDTGAIDQAGDNLVHLGDE